MDLLLDNLNKYGTSPWVLRKFLPTLLLVLVSLLFIWDAFVGIEYLVPVWKLLESEYQVIWSVLLITLTTTISFVVDSSFPYVLSSTLGTKKPSPIWRLPVLAQYYSDRLRAELKGYAPYRGYEELLGEDANKDKETINGNTIPRKSAESSPTGDDQEVPPPYYQLFPPGIPDSAFSAYPSANLLMAISETIRQRYGLDVGTTWDILSLQIDDKSQEYISDTRTTIDLNVRLQLYSVLVFGILSGIFLHQELLIACAVSFFLGIFSKLFLSQLLLHQLVSYGRQVMMVYASHRFKLYEQLRLAPPSQSAEVEVEAGEKLSQFLSVGAVLPFDYQHPPEK